MKSLRNLIRTSFSVLLLLLLAESAQAFTHPGLPLRKDDLDYVKARLTVQPWKAGWDALQADGNASLSYTMQGPFETVSRVPNFNQNQWKNDMDAVYKLALRSYLSGDSSYAAKALEIWRAWITTMTSYSGNENYLDIGDYAVQLFGGPEILRGTYAGWTAQDTTNSINYYNTAIKPALVVPYPVRGANQGMAMIKSALGLAAFCDDTTYWNQVLFAYRNDGDGLLDTAPLGMVGDTGRDQGHSRGQFGHYAWAAAVAWSQGVDLFSEQDNRLAKCAEYFSKYNVYNTTPYVTFGSIYGLYPTIGSSSRGFDLPLRNIIQTAYGTRKGMSLPWMARMSALWGDDVGFEFLRLSDPSTATYSPLTSLPMPALVTAGAWTDVEIGAPALAGSSSYDPAGGVWTISGSGADLYYNGTSNDQFHFAYKAMSSDFTFVARVVSITGGGANAKAGLMVRESLSATANNADIYLTPTTVEAEARGALGVSHGDFIRTFTQPMPYWIKVERRGEWMGRYSSPDGLNWQPVNYAWTTMSSGTVYVGLLACANNNSALITAKLDNLALSGPSGPGVAPALPTSLTATAGKAQVTLNWLPGAGSTYCNLKRATASGGPYTTIASNLPITTYTDLDLSNGATYYYVVSDTNSVGESANSSPASATPTAAAAVPAAPANLTAFASDGRVDLTWDAVTGAVSYNVKRSTTNGGPYTRVFYGTDREVSNFTDMGLTNGTTYYYIVDAVNSFGESADSNQVTANPKAALVWTGASNGTWSTSATGNWTSNGSAAVYANGQPVQFDDTASNFSVSPSTTLTPTAVLFNNSLNSYTLNTTGIGGGARVTKRGTGDLTIDSSQPFTGGMEVDAPCEINFYGSTASIGTGLVNINADVNLWATSTITWSGNLTNGFVIAPDATLTYSGDRTVALSGNLTGAGVLRMLPGGHASSVTMSGNNSGLAGTVEIGGGKTVLLSSTNAGSASAIWNFSAGGNQLSANVSNGSFYLGQVMNNAGVVPLISNNVISANTATFILGNSTDSAALFEGAFVDNGSGKVGVTKVGTNTQVLTGPNSYTGPTNVNAGLFITTTHATGAGSYAVSSNATLGVMNQLDGTTLNVGSLSLSANAALDFFNVRSSTTAIISAANVTLSGNALFNIADANYLVSGATYPLVSYTGSFTGNISNFSVAMPAGWSGAVSNSANKLWLTVTGSSPASLSWGSGATTGLWSAAGNWGGVAPKPGDNLSFAATSGTKAITNDLTDPLVGSVTFNSGASAYSLAGNRIYLKGDLINNSTAAQTFSFPIVLLNNINISTNTGSVVLNGTLDKNTVGVFGITKLGSGTLSLNGLGTFAGGVTLNAGTLAVSGNGTNTYGPLGTGPLILAGGAIEHGSGATLYNPIVSLPGTNTVINEVSTGNNLSLYGNITGSGTITTNANVSYGGVRLYGDNSGFTGTCVFGGGNAARNKLATPSSGSASARWVFNGVSDSPAVIGGGTIELGELSGNAADVRNDSSSGTMTFSVGALNTSSNWAGNLTAIGSLALTKVGTGTLTVSGTNSYFGATTINAGTLNLTGSLTGNSPVTVNTGGTLAGTGTSSGTLTVASGGIVAPGNAGTGTLTIAGTFQPSSGSVLAIEVGNTADKLALTGSYVPPGNGPVIVNVTDLPAIAQGTYTILSGATGITLSSFTLGSVPADFPCSLSVSGSSLLLTVRVPGTTSWNGATSGNWSDSSNWGGFLPLDGDTLSFTNSTATSLLVNDLSGFSARALLFNTGANAFTLSGNSLKLNGDITNNSTSTETLSLPLVLSRNSNVTASTGAITISSVISEIGDSRGLTKLGSGLLTLSALSTFAGGVTLNSGTLAISGTGTSSAGAVGTGTLTLAGGTLRHGSSTVLYNDVVAQDGTTTTMSEMTTGNNLDLYGNLSGSGSIITSASANYGGVRLYGDNSAFTGTFTFGNSGSARNKFGSASAGSAFAKWALNGSTDSPSLLFGAGTLELGELSGSSANIRQSGSGTSTIRVGALNTNSTWAGSLSNIGSIALEKVGTGTLTVSGNNAYTGATTINGGTLNLTGTLSGTSGITVNNGGILGGTSTVSRPVTVAGGGAIAPGNGTPGTLSFSNLLSLGSGSSMKFELGTNSDKVALTGTAAYTGPSGGVTTINVAAVSGFGATNYTLITGATGINAASFVLGSVPIGYNYALSASGGSLTLTTTAWTAQESWRYGYFGISTNTGIAADSADPDGDGFNNAQEFAAGTNPTDRTSALKVSQLQPAGSSLLVSFTSVSGKSYRVEYSDTLASGSWSAVLTNGTPANNIAGNGGTVEVTDTGGALQGRRFYRVVLGP